MVLIAEKDEESIKKYSLLSHVVPNQLLTTFNILLSETNHGKLADKTQSKCIAGILKPI